MVLNVTDLIVDYKGETLKTTEDGKERNQIWRDIIFTALNNNRQEERLNEEEKLKCFRISMMVLSNDEVDLTIDDWTFVKGRIDKIYFAPLIIGRAAEFFDPKVEKKEEPIKEEVKTE